MRHAATPRAGGGDEFRADRIGHGLAQNQVSV
jgi:hypothetical protein